jgi:Holliday junction resolvase
MLQLSHGRTRKDTKQMPINSQVKGKNAEREFAALCNRIFGFTNEEGVRRTPCSGALSNFKGDLIQTRGALARYHWEVKAHKTVKVWDFMRQAETDATFDKQPIVAMKQHGTGRWYCVIDAAALLELIKEVSKNE